MKCRNVFCHSHCKKLKSGCLYRNEPDLPLCAERKKFNRTMGDFKYFPCYSLPGRYMSEDKFKQRLKEVE